jgi:hypothetical protein
MILKNIRNICLCFVAVAFCFPLHARAGYYETNGYAVYEGIQTIQLRPFAREFTTGVLWYAVTARMAAPWDTDQGAKYTYIATGDNQEERHFRMGYWNQAGNGSPTDGIFDNVATGINMTNWQTFLLRFDLENSNVYGWAGNLDGYDIDIFSPPIYTNNSVAALKHFYLWKGAYMNLYIDWIGLGTEVEDVVPIPEPALFSILGMISLVFTATYRSSVRSPRSEVRSP